MSESRNVSIHRLPSGVGKLDAILGGGWPEYSFNLVVGEPGCGKTTLAHQFMFANAAPERPALYFTVLGEPTIKMLRYQQQFTFFDMAKVNGVVRFANLNDEALTNDLGTVLKAIEAKIDELSPRIVIVDSFRTLMPKSAPGGSMSEQEFVQRLAMKLTSWQATTFLLGEYPEAQIRENPVFTMADGLVVMTQRVDRNSMVRQVQVMKMRGNAPQPGLHTIRISQDGVAAFPRMLKPIEEAQAMITPELISTGIPGLDDLMGGGTLRGNAVLIAGPVGSGKTTTALQFIAEGVKHQETGVVVIFEETVPKYLDQAKGLGVDLEEMNKQGLVEIVYVRPLDLSMDETLYAIQTAVDKVGAKRVALDSISGLEAALAPAFKEDFLESLYRLLGALTGGGVTILLTVEVIEPYNEMRFTPHPISFLTHDIVLQRYFEIDGELRTFLTVIKTRARAHSRDLRAYDVTSKGLVVGKRLKELKGIITAVPKGETQDKK
ncbi:MAG TPA: ATPase domain-containing protein [Vicinamibacterales bacterium]|jgi:circadian clock protein KaiC|nr:ATPase domain-containing protein [Vicinamibacterales bacterium]